MLHQDLRPENIMIDRTGTVKIIDSAVHVAGWLKQRCTVAVQPFWAPCNTPRRVFLGRARHTRDQTSFPWCHHLPDAHGRLPYGTQVAACAPGAALSRLRYASALHDESRPIPAWIDAVLERAVHPNPLKRQAELSEFVHELHQPGAATLACARPPLAERNH